MHFIKYLVLCSNILLAFSLSACAAKSLRHACANELNSARQAMDLAETDGFGHTASYAKALSLLTSARTMQTLASFDNCYRQAKDAHFYIREARKG